MFYMDEKVIAPCPNCGADGQHRQWRDTHAYNGPLKVITDAHKILGSDVVALICTKCGNVQMFVNPEDFKHE